VIWSAKKLVEHIGRECPDLSAKRLNKKLISESWQVMTGNPKQGKRQQRGHAIPVFPQAAASSAFNSSCVVYD